MKVPRLIVLFLLVMPVCVLASETSEQKRHAQLKKLQSDAKVFSESEAFYTKGRQAFIKLNVPMVAPFTSDQDYWNCRFGFLYDSMPDKAKWLYGAEAVLKISYPDLRSSDINDFLASKVEDIGIVLAQAAVELAKANSLLGDKCGMPTLPPGWQMTENGEVFFSNP